MRNSAGEDLREGVYVTSTNEEELTGSKGTCHFQVKWARDAKSSAYLNVQETVKGVTQRAITGVHHSCNSFALNASACERHPQEALSAAICVLAL